MLSSSIFKFKTIFMLMLFLISSIYVVIAVSEPEGPTTIIVTNSSRRSAQATSSISAYAGNISELVIQSTTVTQSWQGYVGNVSGYITLDNSDGDSLYNWTIANPGGEVYATSRSSVNWATGNVFCWNWSDPIGSEYILSELEADVNIGASDVDGVDETFTCDMCDSATITTTHTSFYVGGQEIVGSSEGAGDGPCPSVKLLNSSEDAVFEEVLLFADDVGTQNPDEIIYTSLLQNSVVGYDGQFWDFEMIVLEDGHSGDVAVTPYYFYVELE